MGKVVLITGVSSGIGLALSKEFCKHDYKVYGTIRKTSKVDIEGLKGIETVNLDVTEPATIKKCVNHIIKKEGKIDILINNAGYGLIGPIAEIHKADLIKQFNTNVFGLLEVTQTVIPHMINSKSGMIVNISSIMAVLTMPFAGAYCATKAAVNSMSDAMRMELKPFNIKVITVQPGAIKSGFGDAAAKNIGRYEHTSIYSTIYEYIHRRAYFSQERSTSAEYFAHKLFKQLRKKQPKSVIRIGIGSFKAPFAKCFLPMKMTDTVFSRMFGLSDL